MKKLVIASIFLFSTSVFAENIYNGFLINKAGNLTFTGISLSYVAPEHGSELPVVFTDLQINEMKSCENTIDMSVSVIEDYVKNNNDDFYMPLYKKEIKVSCNTTGVMKGGYSIEDEYFSYLSIIIE